MHDRGPADMIPPVTRGPFYDTAAVAKAIAAEDDPNARRQRLDAVPREYRHQVDSMVQMLFRARACRR